MNDRYILMNPVTGEVKAEGLSWAEAQARKRELYATEICAPLRIIPEAIAKEYQLIPPASMQGGC